MTTPSLSRVLRCVIYARTSTTQQEASIGQQVAWAEEAANRERMQVVGVFKDEGVPGDELARRAGLVALLEFVEAEALSGRRVNCVVCWDLDRLSRSDSFKMAVLLERLIESGATLAHSKEGWHDWEDDTARIMNSLRQDFSRRGYSRAISGNVTRSCIDRARLGQWVGGRYPYGYLRGPDKHLAPDPDKAEWARWMFQTYLNEDTSMEELARELTRRGAPPPDYAGKRGAATTRKTGVWTSCNINAILINPIYTGAMYYNRSRKGKYHKIAGGQVVPSKKQTTASGRARVLRVPAEEQTVVPNAHPALVDEATFQAVRKKLQANKPGFVPGTTRRTFAWLFGNGMLRCGNCDAVMWGVVTNTGKNSKRPAWESRVYCCGNYMGKGGRRSGCGMNAIKESKLLEMVAARIAEHFSQPELLGQVRQEMERQERNRSMDTTGRTAQIKKRLAELEALIAGCGGRLVRVPEDGIPEVMTELRKLKAERETLRSELTQAEAAESNRHRAEVAIANGLERLQALPKLIDKAPPKQVRQLLQAIVAKIVLNFRQEEVNGRLLCEYVDGTIYPTEAARLLGMPETIISNEDIRLPMSEK